jgi:hypothetical protein
MIQHQSREQMMGFMTDHLFINEKRKKDLGEVMTPPELIEQMCDQLPPSVWTNPQLTWLEPTCGSGHFMICIYFRLMDGLANRIDDATQRHTHIIEKMLFMVDINLKNVDTCRHVFGPSANIECGDVLQYTQCADIIIGNVPFQSKSLAGGKSKLYEKITSHCLGLLPIGGWMSLITPDNLFCGGSKTYRRLLEHQVHLLNVCKSIQRHFPSIQQYICYFLLEKRGSSSIESEKTTKTSIICNNGDLLELVLIDRPINPIRDWTELTETLLTKYISNTRNTSVYVRGNPTTSYVGDTYKVIFTPTRWLYTDDETIVGLGIKKVVIFSMSIHFEFMVDWDGAYGVGPNTFYIPIQSQEDGLRWAKLLESEEYRMLGTACRTCRQFIKNAFVNHLVKI